MFGIAVVSLDGQKEGWSKKWKFDELWFFQVESECRQFHEDIQINV